MIDGTLNIRYLLVDMTNPGYGDLIAKFTALHEIKEVGNTLTVRPNIENTQSIVKVVAQLGWAQSEDAYLKAEQATGLVIYIYHYSELNQVRKYLRSPEWPQFEL